MSSYEDKKGVELIIIIIIILLVIILPTPIFSPVYLDLTASGKNT